MGGGTPGAIVEFGTAPGGLEGGIVAGPGGMPMVPGGTMAGCGGRVTGPGGAEMVPPPRSLSGVLVIPLAPALLADWFPGGTGAGRTAG
jgi:hypothetical protein